jgi:lysophospholipase L1-like esterase
MKSILFTGCWILVFLSATSAFSQTRRMVAIGSSTTAGLVSSSADSSWVGRFDHYYKRQLGLVDTTYNLGVSGTTVYRGMPSSYLPPTGLPAPDPEKNVTRAVTLLSTLSTPANGVVIVNFPTNGYDNYTITEILNSLQLIYDSATRAGNKCFITTTQPRSDGNFASSAVKRKLATIKDSIINRFGEARTINFWNGMYDPTDTTILAAYSAGDNVHFNNVGHRVLFERVVAKNVFSITQTGDYRSNVNPTGLWSNASSWQVYDGVNWVTATSSPTSGTAGVITIVTGDSIRINTATSFDQVVIESGASLSLFNLTTPTTFTLNNGDGNDIEVYGGLFISAGSILTGTGTIHINNNGLFNIRNRGVVEVKATNRGQVRINSTGILRNTTLVNNKTLILQDFTLQLIQSTLTNNDSIHIASNGDTYFADSTLSGGFINNTASGVIVKGATTGTAYTTPSISFTNNGRIKGVGTYQFLNTIVNNGIIAPGTSPGILTVNPSAITGRAPAFQMDINTTGAVAGTNYDQLQFSTVGSTNTNLTGVTLFLKDYANDPVGTTYILARSPAGTITGPFAGVNIPGNFGNLTFSGNAVTVQKLALTPLPLTWGSFNIKADRNRAILTWSTLQEINTALFTIEYGTDGQRFSALTNLSAKGNSSTVSEYSFIHQPRSVSGKHYYRIKQVDLDGRFTYSKVQAVAFEEERNSFFTIFNPVNSIFKFTIHRDNVTIHLSDGNGRIQYIQRFNAGTHQVNVTHLPAGVYWVSIFQNGKRIAIQSVTKL